MSIEMILMRELIRARMINAKREKEMYRSSGDNSLAILYEGQEIMAKSLLDHLEA